MKDMPALLLARRCRGGIRRLMDRVFDRVIDSTRMLRNFVQIVRSGATGRKSLGSPPKRCVRRWLDQRTDEALFAASVGQRAVARGRDQDGAPEAGRRREREALYGYLIGRRTSPIEALPAWCGSSRRSRPATATEVPDVPFQMLTAPV